MKITKTFPRVCLSLVMSLTFFLLPVTSINVSATGTSNEGNFWHGFYVEHVTKEISGNAVDIGNAESTVYGISTGNYIYNQSGVTTKDIIDYVSDQYNNAKGYVVESASDYADKVKNVLNRTIDGTIAAGYKAEKALRTVVDSSGNVYYNVSSSDYWNGIYNKWFNNSGYNNIYQDVTGDWSFTQDNVVYNIQFIGMGTIDGFQPDGRDKFVNTWDGWRSYNNPNVGLPVFRIGSNLYINNAVDSRNQEYNNLIINNVVKSGNSYIIYWTGYLNGVQTQSNSSLITINGGSEPSQTTDPVLQPKQVGFIIYNGDKVPIYTDKTLNPSDWVINDNGTVSVNGDDYPALVDEKDISDDGWLDMLNLLDGEDQRQMSLKDPWGNPWDTQDDGTVLGGFFGNLVKDIQKMFKGIGDTIKKIFEKPIDVLSDLVEKIKKALSDFFSVDYGSLDDVELDVNYNIIETIWQKLLELLGVTS